MNTKILNIANFFTFLNLLCGLISSTLFFEKNFYMGAFFVLLSCLFDFLDGFFARRLNIKTEFGKNADSLCDMVSFGVSPAILLYSMTKNYLISSNSYTNELEINIISSLTFIYCISCLIRLSNFNLSKDHHFKGIPTPASAIAIVYLPFSNFEINLIIIFLHVLLLSLFMNIKTKIFSLKNITEIKTKKFLAIFLFLSIFLFVFFNFTAIPMLLIIYIILSKIFLKNEKIQS